MCKVTLKQHSDTMQHLESLSFPKVTGCDKTLQSVYDVDFQRFSSHSKKCCRTQQSWPNKKKKTNIGLEIQNGVWEQGTIYCAVEIQ